MLCLRKPRRRLAQISMLLKELSLPAGYLRSRSVLYSHASVVEWKYPLQILVEENIASSLFSYSPKLPPIESSMPPKTYLWTRSSKSYLGRRLEEEPRRE
ncbi:hypothetical protein CI102_4321 [Trichoderma harzianum]|uniref:Uncharacterized protein n=1 Tax=Trichoderma harzianum CBS 226.95 TaxID=983964 RepID=A0A2T4ASX2_TRIHA|nr:hypothetical protein M431DRAFT_502279 [Trichoderma harzianum CBS 226.95]PKK50221.1 hypothetical protein CI102_4321 [Trichoderma harzianum]PTB60162.1 hypothetical protein M431DRAFT_502279 [Trichoderma harzianum CBS 226.95]